MTTAARASLRRQSGVEQRTTALELFYDLVFVFAVTQVSHLLLRHLTWEGAGQAALVLLVVWWSWNYTTWVTNELDPESILVRGLLIALMLATLLMAIAIPQAFGDEALLFVVSYVAIQVGRHTYAGADLGVAVRTARGVRGAPPVCRALGGRAGGPPARDGGGARRGGGVGAAGGGRDGGGANGGPEARGRGRSGRWLSRAPP